MFCDKKNFLNLLADSGDSFVSSKDEKPLSLKVTSAIALLHSAISSKDVKAVENLMKLGLLANSKFKNQKTPLRLAVESNQAHMIDILAFYGANINEEIEPRVSFLHYAVNKGFTEVVEALICAGLDVNVCDHDGYPLFYRAAENGDLSTAAVFHRYDADEFFSELPLIHLAVERNSIKAIECFASLSMEMDILDKYEETPLYRAARSGNVTILKALVKSGADMYLRDSEGYSYLHNAVRQNDHISVKTLLSAGMNVNVTGGWWNFTPLHLSASLGRFTIAKLLIEFNADINAMTSDGKTASIIARHNGHHDFNFLLSPAAS